MKRAFLLLKNTFTQFSAHKAPRLGAALAYYTIFSIAPLLLIAIAIAGFVFGREAVQNQIVEQLRGVLGTNAAQTIQEMVKNAAKPKSGTIATIIGIITLLFGAGGIFSNLKDAINTIWDVEPKKSGGIMAAVREKFLSLVMVLGIGFLLLVSLVIDTVISVMGKYASQHLPGGEALWQAVQLAVSFAVVTVLFAMIFRFLPDAKVAWRGVWIGAAVTAFLFIVGKFGLSIYLGKAAVGSSFGAAGSLVVVLVWVYWSAQILLFGAEFTHVYCGVPAKEKEEAPAPAPAIVYRTERVSAGGAGKLAIGGLAGLALGTVVGSLAGVIVMVKTVKKFFTP
jgi:membrane protein